MIWVPQPGVPPPPPMQVETSTNNNLHSSPLTAAPAIPKGPPPDIFTIPGELVLSGDPKGSNTVERFLAVRSRSGQSFTIKKVFPPATGVTLDIADKGATQGFLVTFHNLPVNGWSTNAAVVIKTSSKNPVFLRIPIRATAATPLEGL